MRARGVLPHRLRRGRNVPAAAGTSVRGGGERSSRAQAETAHAPRQHQDRTATSSEAHGTEAIVTTPPARAAAVPTAESEMFPRYRHSEQTGHRLEMTRAARLAPGVHLPQEGCCGSRPAVNEPEKRSSAGRSIDGGAAALPDVAESEPGPDGRPPPHRGAARCGHESAEDPHLPGSHFDLDRQHPRRSGRMCRRGYGVEDLSYRHHRAWEAEWPIR